MTPDPLHDAAEPVAAPDAVRAGRRRLLRGGLASAPVLLSLTSRPVTATTCTQASSHASVNMSRPDRMYSCGGKKPYYWKHAHSSNWPSNLPPSTLFDSIFGSSGGYGAGVTLKNVVEFDTTDGKNGVACHLVAAVLNARKSWTPLEVLSEITAKNIWASFVSLGYYEPTAGIKWYPAYSVPDSPTGGLVAWIRTTMPA